MNIVLVMTLCLTLVIILFFILRVSENFSEVSLYNENLLYTDLRNYINGKIHKHTQNKIPKW